MADAADGRTALETWAPRAAAALDRLAAARPEPVASAWVDAVRAAAPAAVGLAPAATPAPDVPAEVVELAEQFAVDVTQVGPDLRRAWFAACGAAVFEATLVVWAADYVPRVRSVLDQVLGASSWPDVGTVPVADAHAVMDDVLVEVARLDTLDAVTTELVRLRGARQHACRVCMSRRSLGAIREGADDATFAAVDDHRAAGLTPPQRAALALTDAAIWTPAAVPAADVAAAREHLAPAQVVEVVLDVMRNAANKIAVALGADAAHVEGDAVELFEVDDAGRLTVPG